MTTIGLFEAKTKLSELCEQVAKRREAVVITRRGRPLVRIEPVGPGKGMSSSVWDSRAAWEKKHGPLREAFEPPARATTDFAAPLFCVESSRSKREGAEPPKTQRSA